MSKKIVLESFKNWVKAYKTHDIDEKRQRNPFWKHKKKIAAFLTAGGASSVAMAPNPKAAGLAAIASIAGASPLVINHAREIIRAKKAWDKHDQKNKDRKTIRDTMQFVRDNK